MYTIFSQHSQSWHINNNSVRAPSGPRRIALKSKHRLNELFMDAMHPHLSNGILESNEYKRVLSTLHTSVVQASIALQGVNPLLATPPPNICDKELSLSHSARTCLSQLRSGHSIRLNNYKHRIGRSATDRCPLCNLEPHSTLHLFSCSNSPTPLTVKVLCTHPREVVGFLSSQQPFADLLPLNPPPPPPSC